jgi:hypothetical protein
MISSKKGQKNTFNFLEKHSPNHFRMRRCALKKISPLFLSALITFACSPAGASESYSRFSLSLDVTGHGAFTDSPTIPLSAGLGACVYGDWRPCGFLSLGTGISYADYPGENDWRVLSWDLGLRLFPSGAGTNSEWYLHGGYGYNLISHNLAKNKSYPGNYHASAGVVYRAMLGQDMAMELGPQYDFYTPFLTLPSINSIGLKAGLTWFFGKNEQAVTETNVTQNILAGQATAPVNGLQRRALGVPISKQEMGASAPGTSMMSVYRKALAAYKAKNYKLAVKYYKQALTIRDPNTQSSYYAESNAMLGVIYQFYGKAPGHLEIARKYYQAAIAIDPSNFIANKHLKTLGEGN